MGWVIQYSDKKELAAQEVIRVSKDKAIIAVGVEYAGEEAVAQIDKLQYTPGAGRLTTKASQLIEFFGDAVDHVYFSHEVEEDRKQLKGSVIAVFSIKK